MGIRFRKTFKLAPGIRMTVGSGGSSFNFGPRGASVSVGKRGVFANSSAFGFSSRTKLSGSTPRQSRPVARAQSTKQAVSVDVTVGVTDQGDLYFKDSAGNPLPEAWVQVAKTQQAEALKRLIQGKCDEINAQIEAVGELHRYTPSPVSKPVFVPSDFSVPKPTAPTHRRVDFFARLFAPRRHRIEAENAEKQRQYAIAFAAWENELATHRQSEAERQRLIEQLIYHDVEAMETYLQEMLQDVAWPRETLVAIDIRSNGRIAFLDIDLPEVEDMPSNTAAVPTRGLKLSVKEMSTMQVQRLYMRHVHAVGFRMIGETFAALPPVHHVVVSGYSQRRDNATGRVKDDYLYSARVTRDAWQKIDFSEEGLAALDVVEALARFDLRRNMSKTGAFKPIFPFDSETESTV